MKVVVTNDDGPQTPLLKPLVEELKKAGHRVVVVVPERPRSAAGLARTFHKPLRVRQVDGGVYVVNGYPADAVFLALKLIAPDAEVVVSGVNVGENVGVEATFGSGTVGAAIQAGVLGVPGVAVSMEQGGDVQLMRRVAAAAVDAVGGGLGGAYAVSINIPAEWGGGLFCPERLARVVYQERLYEGVDPRGEAFYWRWGPRRERLDAGTDAYYFYTERGITVVGLWENGVVPAVEYAKRLGSLLGVKYIKC